MSRRRRWTIGAGVVVVALVLAGAIAWFVWLPNWRPPLRAGEQYGIDVASHQGLIDWVAVADDNIDFAYIKATEGEDFTDVRFKTNWQGSEAAGMNRGAYHFFTLCTPGASQAEHFLEIAPPEPDALAPAVDLELAGNCAGRPSPTDVAVELDQFMRLVEDEWDQPLVLYVGDDWERQYPVRTRLDRPLWHRRILRRPNVDGWIIWQIHGMAKIDGINGPVDLNIMRAST